MSSSLCEDCYKPTEDVAIQTGPPIAPCEICGRYDTRHCDKSEAAVIVHCYADPIEVKATMTMHERVRKARDLIIFAKSDSEIDTIIRRALIEQDKITLHAAAEAINSVDCYNTTYSESEAVVLSVPKCNERIKTDCHSAVMNCRGGVR